MKKNFKFKLGLLTSLLAIFFLTSSCEKDLYENSLQNGTKEMNVHRISLKDIDKSISTKITSEISKVKNMKYETSKEGNRIEYNSELDIYIDTDNGNVVSVDGKNFYTFPMFKDDDNKIENVLFVDNGTGEMDTYLIKYDITPQEFENLTTDQVQNIDAEYQKIFWSGGEQVCFTWTTTTTVYQNCPYPGGLHSNGLQCEGEVHVNSTTLCTFVEVFGQGDSLGGNGGDGVGGDTSGGHTGSGSTGNTIHTGIGTSPELIKMKEFVKNLPIDLENCYNQNEDIQGNLLNYLDQNNFSSTSLSYATTVLNEIYTNINNVTPLATNINLITPNPTLTILDINDYLKCFDLTQAATFTLYVDQPTPNSNTAWSGNPLDPNVGHTFIAIKQGGIRRVLGFYPSGEVSLANPSITGNCQNDSGHEYDVAISYTITATQLASVINHIKTHSTSQYNLNSYNCTDFGMNVTNASGLSLPSAYGTWGMIGIGSGAGDNPGQLGQNIRNMPTPTGAVKTTTTGNAQINAGGC